MITIFKGKAQKVYEALLVVPIKKIDLSTWINPHTLMLMPDNVAGYVADNAHVKWICRWRTYFFMRYQPREPAQPHVVYYMKLDTKTNKVSLGIYTPN